MNWATGLQLLAAIGGLAGISALINLVISRRKVLAEAADTAQNTTDKIIDQLRVDNKNMRDELIQIRLDNKSLQSKMTQYEQMNFEIRMYAIKMYNWSREAMLHFNEHDIPVSPPPKTNMSLFEPEAWKD